MVPALSDESQAKIARLLDRLGGDCKKIAGRLLLSACTGGASELAFPVELSLAQRARLAKEVWGLARDRQLLSDLLAALYGSLSSPEARAAEARALAAVSEAGRAAAAKLGSTLSRAGSSSGARRHFDGI
eukprot:tig00020927_g15968.t1